MLSESAGPAHLHGVEHDGRAQTEVNAQIVLRNVARTTAHFIYQYSLPNLDGDLGADPVTIGAGSHSFESDPVISGSDRIDQETWFCVNIVDDDGKLSIVPEITHRQAARRGSSVNSVSCGC